MNLSAALSAYVSSLLNAVHTSVPARVESYDSKKKQATVVPTVRASMGNGVELELPKLQRVPIVFPSSAAFDIEFPISRGDLVLLVFSECDLASWISSTGNEVVSPGSPNKFGLNSAIAIPGLYPTGKSGKASMKVDESGVLTISARKIKLDGQVIASSDVIARGDVYAGPSPAGPGVSLKTHVHPSAVGPTGTATPTPIPPEVV